MSIIRWRPFEELEESFEDIEPFRANGWDLAADVYEDKDKIVVEMHLPGIDPNKVDIDVDENYLRISGSREESEEKKEKNFFKKEIRRGSFERVIPLPCAVESEKAQAECKEGTLKIILPKKQGKQPSKIQIKKM